MLPSLLLLTSLLRLVFPMFGVAVAGIPAVVGLPAFVGISAVVNVAAVATSSLLLPSFLF